MTGHTSFNKSEYELNRENDYFDEVDGYDGYSDADYPQLPGRGIGGVEDLSMLQGLSDVEREELPNVEE